MTAAEIVGTILTALLLGTLNGVLLAKGWFARKRRIAGMAERQVDVFAQWLGAYKVLNRSSLSFVAAHRAVASTSVEKNRVDQRNEIETQARSSWKLALLELDRAEASLIAWCDDESLVNTLQDKGREARRAFRRMLDGRCSDFDVLVEQFRAMNNQADTLIRDVTNGIRTRRPGLLRLLDRISSSFQAMVGRWTGST